MIRYTKEQREFLIANNYMTPSKELAEMFNKEFGTNITSTNIKTFRGNNHLNSGLTGRFEKGHVPQNKGKKWDEYMSKESQEKSLKSAFKKGNKPHNRREIGEERVSKDGYIEIKIKDGCLNDNWELKHRYLYEQYYGKIPKGYKVIFLDGNKRNFNIENLKAISNHDELIMNEYKLRFNSIELTKSGHIIAQIESKRRKLKNDRL